jgi:arylsulfatase A-like enzyme
MATSSRETHRHSFRGVLTRLSVPGSVALAIACTAVAPAPTPGIDRLTGLGTRTFVRLRNETRPALQLRSGDRRSCRAVVLPGSRLLFSVGLLKGGPSDGLLHLVIRVGGRSIFEHRFRLEGHEGFWDRTVPLSGSGPTTLELAADLEETSPAEEPACIAIASLRLLHPPLGGRRTLLWLSQDTVRADHLGTYGYTRPTSSRFDRMARDWAVFDNAVATASWTLPSLASQFMSRYPSYHGAVMESQAANDDPTVFERLAADGFTVIGVTANPYVSAERSLARGFDALFFTDGRATEVNRQVLDALDLWAGGDLAIFVHYMDPHLSYAPPPPYDRMFDDPRYHGEVRGVTNFFKIFKNIGPADTEHLKALYDGEIAFTDVAIGHLVKELGRRRLLDGAVIAYTADHGEEFRDHGSWGHGTTLYDELVHVPFALRVPGLPARHIAQPVSLVDLAPTLLDALGIRSPPTFQGQSLLPLLRGRALPRETAFSETILTPDRNQLVALRSSSWKYILTVPRGRDPAPVPLKEELYDLAADPGEHVNRMDSPEAQPLRRRALAYVSEARTNGRPGPPAAIDKATLDKLRAWGYGP